MKLFDRRKNRDSGASTLSEEEIQKRLYGEFKMDPTRVAGASDRETAVSGLSVSTVKPPAAEPAPDLFSAAKELTEKPARPETFVTSREIKVAEGFSKPLSTKPAERLSSPSAFPTSGSQPRFREVKKPVAIRTAGVRDAVGLLKSAWSFFSRIFDAEQVIVRRVLYWAVGVLVVFSLFWGVNALNVSRETAMKAPRVSVAQQPADVRTARLHNAPVPQTKREEPQVAESVPEGATVPSAKLPVSQPRKASIPAAGEVPAGRFVIQVAIYPSEDYATKLAASLKQSGFNGFVKESVRPSGAVQYWVLIGGFRTASEAHQQLSRFKASEVSRPFTDAYIKTLETE